MNFAVVGCGIMGTMHAAAAAADPRCSVGLCVDVDLAKAKELAEKVGATASTNYDDALSDDKIDAIILTTPSRLHAEYGVRAAHAGKHIFMEKPMDVTIEGADAVLSAARKGGVRLFVAHVLRFHPAYQRIKEIIAKRVLGDAFFVRLHGEHFVDISERPWITHPAENGTLGGGCIHHVDVFRWWMGEIKSVTGFVRSIYKEFREAGTPDLAMVICDFENGALGECTYSLAVKQDATMAPEVEVSFTEGKLALYSGGDIRIYSETGALEACPEHSRGGGKKFEQIKVEDDWRKAVAREVPHFTDCVLEGKPFLISAEEARDAVEVVVRARESAEKGRKVFL